MKLLTSLWLLLYLPLCVSATVIHVPDDYETIQVGIDAAVEGDTVLVAPGTYSGEGNRDLDFFGKNIVLLSADGLEYTIIDCEELGRGFHLISGESHNSIISGFTIERGYADKGGCIYIEDSSPRVVNCFLVDGSSGGGGAGVRLVSSSSIINNCIIINCISFGGAVSSRYSYNIFSNCIIQGNECDVRGAGMDFYCTSVTVSDCIITENIIDSYSGDAYGGGIYSYNSDIFVERCEISNNTCLNGWDGSAAGGGIYGEYGSFVITDCLITGNYIRQGGGGGILLYDLDFISIDNCMITDNVALANCYGGGISVSSDFMTIISDCVISGNNADFGGGINCGSNDGFTEIRNCTITDNTADSTSGGSRVYKCSVSFTDCISRNNYPEEIICDDGSAEVSWTNIEGGWPGEGNIDEEPLFVAPEYSDYRLLWGSPCIDSGNPDSLDLDGTVRDMGARSFDQSKELIVYLSPETGEIAPGETGLVKYTVCNAHPSEKNFGTAAGVRRPDGSPWPGNPLEEPFYTSIAPSSNLTREFEYRVPLGWISGTYTLAAGVGYRGRIYDLDHFEFAVK